MNDLREFLKVGSAEALALVELHLIGPTFEFNRFLELQLRKLAVYIDQSGKI